MDVTDGGPPNKGSTRGTCRPIEIKPSTESIADEYPHDDNSKAVVHIFQGKDETRNVTNLKETLESCNYIISDKHMHQINTKKNVEKILNELARDDYTDKSSLIIIFIGATRRNYSSGCLVPMYEMQPIYIKDIWSKFLLCKSLKNKPKIFIFQAAIEDEGQTVTDSFRLSDDKYDVPVEADLFIVYRMVEWDHADEFIEGICNNIKKFGNRDDILDIVTHTRVDRDTRRPLIISTLTRKYYLNKNRKARGTYHDLVDELDNCHITLEKVQSLVRRIQKSDVMDGTMGETLDVPSSKRKVSDTVNVTIEEERELPSTSIQQNIRKPASVDNLYVTLGSNGSLDGQPRSPGVKPVRRRSSASFSEQMPTRPRANSRGNKPPWR